MMRVLLFIFTGLFFVKACFGHQDKIMKKTFEELFSMTCDHDKTLELNTSGIKIYFHNFENNGHAEYHIGNALKGIAAQDLNITKNLVVYVPGYKSDINTPTVGWIKEEFQKNQDAYFIVVDYSAYTTSAVPIPIKAYKMSVTYAYYIGRSVGLLLSGLRDRGFSSQRIHGIGHSFGAQLLGYIGGSYRNSSSEMIGRLSALDPAGICFSNGHVEDQIRSGVAKYVEVYHCNAGFYGSTSVLADADFFFGNGRTQPRCVEKNTSAEAESCSHTSCVRYWAKSINNSGYWARACHSYEALKEVVCERNGTTAGYRSTGNATGVFLYSRGVIRKHLKL